MDKEVKRERARLRAAAWYANNRERALQSARNYRVANREKLLSHYAEFRQNNREKIRKAESDWRKANPEKAKEQSLKSRARHKDQLKAKKIIYSAKNSKVIVARVTAWQKANPDKKRLYALLYALRHPDKIRECRRRRRSRKLMAEGFHTADELHALLIKQKYKCANPVCRVSLRDGYHGDHIVPISKGGSDWIKNIQLLCAPCNFRKSAKDPIRWAQENGLLL